MSISIKASGVWHNVTNFGAKVTGVWKSTTSNITFLKNVATITNATGTGSVITFTLNNTIISKNNSITVAGVNPTAYNGTYTVTGVTSTGPMQSTITVAGAATATYVSGGTASTWKQLLPTLVYTVTDAFNRANTTTGLGSTDTGGQSWLAKVGNFFISSNQAKSTDSVTITNATYTSPTLTYTATNSFVVGQTVSIQGVVSTGNTAGVNGNLGYNRDLVQVANRTASSFTVTVAGITPDPGTYTSGGVAVPHSVAAVELIDANVQINLDVDTTGAGTGAAFWVTDASNWWGVQTFNSSTTSYAQGCSVYGPYCTAFVQSAPGYTCTGYGQTCPGGYTQTCTTTSYTYTCSQAVPYYIGFSGTFGYNCNQYGSASYCSQFGSSCTGGFSTACTSSSGPSYTSVCSSASSYASQCTTYVSVPSAALNGRYLRLIKSAANVVTVVLDTAISSAAASIQVSTSGLGLTLRAYSSAGQNTQIGTDITYTATGATTATQHGLLLAPGGFNQGTVVDNLTINPN